jgi:hypothetical protein
MLVLRNFKTLQHCHGAGAGVDPGFLGPDTIFGTLFQQKNAKLQIKNLV